MTVPKIDYISWMLERVPAAAYDLASSGAPTVGPEDLALGLDAMTDYTAPARFRDALAARYGVPGSEIAFALGASGAVWCACRALLAPGDAIAVESPAYQPLVRVPDGLGARVVRFERRAQDGYQLDPDAVMRALGNDGRVALVTDLHNPTGAGCDRRALWALARSLQARGGWLIVDEVYREVFARRDGPVTARTIAPNVVAVSSMTKVCGLSWARSGWVFAPESVCNEVTASMVHIAGWYGFLYAAAGAAGLARADVLIDRTVASVGDRLARVDALVRARPYLRWTKPEGGLFGLVEIARDELGTARALIDGPCRERGVLVGDGAFFDAPRAFRVGCVAADEATFARGLELLGDALDAFASAVV